MGNYTYDVKGEYDHGEKVEFSGQLHTVNGMVSGMLVGPQIYNGDRRRFALPEDREDLVFNNSWTKGKIRVVEDIRMIELIKYAPRDLMSGEIHVYHADKLDDHRTKGKYQGYMFVLENVSAFDKSARQIAHTLEEMCSFMTPVGDVRIILS